ncbi:MULTISPECIES: metal-sensitive transcriptional regulator [Cellulomonas]|uniref:Metal-sensitive transcriptional regulator n=1 Tax=Cellulomonas denverensis TaxID=264297 RepID=A0A7X6KY89_9CELL|nr:MULTISPECIES: metal-sensitive transcriptional regulator [Cellulomonas]NKY24374.1 metal-sensitive transcriptional regulator [Cellulomonas denverensis]QZN87765.1 metal-sensitive transcriptional regulator [Cellulomonas sp. C5510]WHP16532.1 metal-sensitive transcriptional regulator [Cellulomonas sp. ES6]GIG26458.1 transcriptional regulator [Cellulomonas denverensis]
MRTTAEDEAVLRRLRRLEGQVRGVATMIESGSYCIDVLTQIAAASGALQAVARQLLDDHIRHCLSQAAQASADVQDERVDEVSQAIARLLRA